MGNYQQLKTAIADVIKANGNQEITGNVLQGVLLSIISNLGAGSTFAGVATPSTVPGTPDQKIFYIASQVGLYPNFGGLTVKSGEIAILIWTGVWSVQTLSVGAQMSNIVETNEDGFYVIDPNYNIGFSVDADGVHGVDSHEIAPTAENTMNVLVIGNSYSTDSFVYLPDLCKVAGISAKIAVLYIGGRSLAQHVSGWDSASYTYYKHIGGSSWSTSSSTIPNALANEKWDWIVTHQVSDSSGMYDTIADPLDTIIKNCINALDYPVKFAYLSTPAWGTQNTGWGDNYTDQADMFNKIVSAVQQVAKNHAIDTIIPVTAAIQNARQTSLQVYGADLFASTSDRHLEDGIARLVASYTVLLALAPRPLAKICSKDFLPHSQVSSYPHTGSFTTVTLDMALIGQACAYAAIKYPYQISVNQ